MWNRRLSKAGTVLQYPPEYECQYGCHGQEDQRGAQIILCFRFFLFTGGLFYLLQLFQGYIRILKRPFPVHFTLKVLHPFPAQSKQFSLLRLIISKTNPEKLIYNSFYKVRGYMGTKVGNNPGIFLRAPALLLLFPVISPPTPGWRGFLRSLPTDVLWPGCSVPTALYTLRAHT